jgi:hypothetical protein
MKLLDNRIFLAILFRPLCFIAPKTINSFAFQSFDLERTWWRLFEKCVVRTKFDIYVFIKRNSMQTTIVATRNSVWSNNEMIYTHYNKQHFKLYEWVSDLLLFNANSAIFPAISWREQVHFSMRWWWWGPMCTRPTRLVGFL